MRVEHCYIGETELYATIYCQMIDAGHESTNECSNLSPKVVWPYDTEQQSLDDHTNLFSLKYFDSNNLLLNNNKISDESGFFSG